MDGAAALGALCVGRCTRIHHGWARQPRWKWIDNRRAHLANQLRRDREGALDRDRSALRFAFCDSFYLLAQLVGSKTIPVADLDRALVFPRLRLAGQRA